MSALPKSGYVRCNSVCPLCANKRTSSVLFDHLIGAGKQRRWYGEAERLGGLKIDYQLILARSLHR